IFGATLLASRRVQAVGVADPAASDTKGREKMNLRSNVDRVSHRGGRRALAVLATLLFVGLIQSASAGGTAAIDDTTAAGLCATAYPPSSGTEPLARCQWDMGVIHANEAHAVATGAGVKVGVIDG